jgi:DNA modification methylase
VEGGGVRTARLFQGDAREVLRGLPEASVHVAIYSPPYWQLRSYLKTGDPAKALELGQEERIDDYIEHQVDAAWEARRVLRDDGTLWIVCGDKHVDDRKWGGKSGGKASAGLEDDGVGVQRRRVKTGLAEGNLAGIPYRLALALQSDGWFWRSIVTWEKKTCMPSSQFGWHWAPHRVKLKTSERAAAGTKHADAHWKPQGSRNGRDFDSGAKWAACPGCKACLPNGGLVLRKGKWRPTTSHETILMFSKSAEYYGDGEGVREEDAGTDHPRRILSRPEPSGGLAAPNSGIRSEDGRNGAGRNLRSVWTLGPEPLAEAHHAAFPSEIPARIIRCSTPDAGCCAACGAPYARVISREFHPQADASPERSVRGCGATKGMDASNRWQGSQRGRTATETLAWKPTCRCRAGDPIPCTVLDSFMGSGRTGVAALELGRSFVGIDLSRTYLETIARPAIAAALAQDVIGEERDTIGLEVDGEQRGLFG